MAISDIFKKDEKKDGAAKKAVAAKKDKKALAVKETDKKTGRKLGAQSAKVLLHARVTEKAAKLGEVNQYVFNVTKGATKNEVAKAVEGYYGVKVIGVNIANIAGKRRRRGRNIINEPGYRKAIVHVKKGQSIEVMPQ